MSTILDTWHPLVITDHAIKRYYERVPDANDLSEEQVAELIRHRVAEATFIYAGSCGASIDARFYIDGDLVFVLASDSDTVVTLYPVDYGFGEEIDTTIRQQLLASILGLHKAIAVAEETMRSAHSAAGQEMATINNRLAVLQAEIEILEQAKQGLQVRKQEAAAEHNLLQARLHEEASKLVLSKRHNLDMLAAVERLASSKKGAKR